MKATDELRAEHVGIELMLWVLQAVSDKFGHGEQVGKDDLDGMMEFLEIFVDKCHHGKEEEFLFPALEAAGVPREEGLIGVLLAEHAEGRALVARLKETVEALKPGESTAPKRFQSAASEYAALMGKHISKENNDLFVTAEIKLDQAKDAELFDAFERLEKERIGPGKHEEFHALLDRLKQEYLE